jgi:hypothetical protein
MIPQPAKGSFAKTETVPQPSTNCPGETLSAEQKMADKLLAEGELNVNTITNEVFYQSHGESLRGKPLSKEMATEWKRIKSQVVEPRISATCDQPEPNSSRTSANASAEATERKGFMSIGADYLKNELNKTMENISGQNKPVGENQLGECLPESKLSAQELAKVKTSEFATEGEKYDHYKKLIVAGGGQINESPGARNIVGIRHPNPTDTGALHNGSLNSLGKYDDTMAVLWTDENGGKHVKEFIDKANTDPNSFWVEYPGHGSPDVNNDGAPDAGRILPGFNKYKISERTVNEVVEECLRPVTGVPIERDLNRDGIFTNDVSELEVRDGGDSFLIHNGKGKRDTGSAGCQTIAADKWPDFMNAIKTDNLPITNKDDIGYTLIQVD